MDIFIWAQRCAAVRVVVVWIIIFWSGIFFFRSCRRLQFVVGVFEFISKFCAEITEMRNIIKTKIFHIWLRRSAVAGLYVLSEIWYTIARIFYFSSVRKNVSPRSLEWFLDASTRRRRVSSDFSVANICPNSPCRGYHRNGRRTPRTILI